MKVTWEGYGGLFSLLLISQGEFCSFPNLGFEGQLLCPLRSGTCTHPQTRDPLLSSSQETGGGQWPYRVR